MNRRGFLGGVGAVLALGTATAGGAAEPADEHAYRGYRVLWRPYAAVPNQWGEVAFWVATRPEEPSHFYAATTFGTFNRYLRTETVETWLAWKEAPPAPNDREKRIYKQRALRLLYEQLP